jgi:hypothetical protein
LVKTDSRGLDDPELFGVEKHLPGPDTQVFIEIRPKRSSRVVVHLDL